MAKAEYSVVTGKVRLSYPQVFSPKAATEGADEKFSVKILVPKSDVATKAAIDRVIKTIQGDYPQWFAGMMQINTNMRDGDGPTKSGKAHSEECKGHWVINASSKYAPGIIDEFGNTITAMDASKVYSGVVARVKLTGYAWNHATGGAGISLGLNSILVYDEGEPFAATSNPTDDFAGFVNTSGDGFTQALGTVGDEELPFS